MSWGSAAEGTSSAGSAASGASTAGSAAVAGNGIGGAAGTNGNIYGSMSEVGGSAAPAAESGFGFDATTAPSEGPTVANANMQTYGTEDPSYMQQGMKGLERFQAGKESNMFQAWEGWGNNPETYGYLASKIPQGGGGQAAPAVTTNINYQQPQNDYLRRRRGY